jgi:UPF0716 protein FxsA
MVIETFYFRKFVNMRFLIGLILLAFPIAELFVLIKLGQHYGWWLLLYLVVVGFLGLQLIRDERQHISAKMMQSLGAGANPIKIVLGSARNMIAGVLLLIPGVITDTIAAILLLIPIKQAKVNVSGSTGYQTKYESAQNGRAANDDVIEGEYTKINEDSLKDK